MSGREIGLEDNARHVKIRLPCQHISANKHDIPVAPFSRLVLNIDTVAEVPGISPRAYHVGCSVKAADYNSSLIHHVRHPMTAFCRAFLAFLILRFGFLRRWRKAVTTSPPQPNTTRIRPRAYTALSPLSDMQTPKRTVSVTLRSVMPRSRQRLTAWKE